MSCSDQLVHWGWIRDTLVGLAVSVCTCVCLPLLRVRRVRVSCRLQVPGPLLLLTTGTTAGLSNDC